MLPISILIILSYTFKLISHKSTTILILTLFPVKALQLSWIQEFVCISLNQLTIFCLHLNQDLLVLIALVVIKSFKIFLDDVQVQFAGGGLSWGWYDARVKSILHMPSSIVFQCYHLLSVFLFGIEIEHLRVHEGPICEYIHLQNLL